MTWAHSIVAAVTMAVIAFSISPASAQAVLRIQAAPAEGIDLITPQPAVENAEAKAPNKDAKVRAVPNANILDRPVLVPALYPNPVAFNINWIGIKPKEAFAAARVLARKRQVAQRRIAAVALAPQNPVNKQALEQQMRKVLEPMLKAELSFATRAASLQAPERQKLISSSKEWFEKFLVDFIKNQDPNQQQMLLQGVQGVWFGGQQQKPKDPRDLIREGIAKIAAQKFPKEKAAAYVDECRKREEFARQVSVDNLVERIDEKVKLSPDQWKKIATSLHKHWDKNRDPQLEAFAMQSSMWPGAPDQWVLPELTPAQQAVLKKVNSRMGHVWFGGGMLGQMFGVNGAIIDDVDVDFAVDVNVEAVQAVPAAAAEAELNPFE